MVDTNNQPLTNDEFAALLFQLSPGTQRVIKRLVELYEDPRYVICTLPEARKAINLAMFTKNFWLDVESKWCNNN